MKKNKWDFFLLLATISGLLILLISLGAYFLVFVMVHENPSVPAVIESLIFFVIPHITLFIAAFYFCISGWMNNRNQKILLATILHGLSALFVVLTLGRKGGEWGYSFFYLLPMLFCLLAFLCYEEKG